MASVKKFEELTFWKEARKLNKIIFFEILNNDSISDKPLKNQINRSSGSIMDNIAEGFERSGNKEFRQFLTISRGSCGEVKSQLIRAFDRNYITKEIFDALYESCKSCSTISKMINGFIKYLNSSNYRGSKFIEEPTEYYYTNNS